MTKEKAAEEFDTFCNNAFINAKAKDLKEDKNGKGLKELNEKIKNTKRV